jgi:hypothetical protein
MRSDDINRNLYALSAGRVGIASRIIERAATHAWKENSSEICREHWAKAVDELPRLIERLGYNPFRTH